MKKNRINCLFVLIFLKRFGTGTETPCLVQLLIVLFVTNFNRAFPIIIIIYLFLRLEHKLKHIF